MKLPKININPERLAGFLVILTTVVTVAAIFGYQGFRMRQGNIFVLETRAPENGNFRPNELHLPADQPIVLEVRNPETVSHGFAVPALNVGIQEIKPGHVERVTLPALQPGTYEFFCSTWCTVNHMEMRGRIRVIDAKSH